MNSSNVLSVRLLFVLIVFAIAGQSVYADTFTVTIKVVDAQMKPEQGVDVSLFWEAKDGVMTPSNPKDVKTNAAGKAVVVIDNWNEKRPVMVLSADRTQGRIAGVSKADAGKEVVVTLGAVMRMNGKVDSKELGYAPKWANVTVTRDGYRAYFTQHITKDAKFEFLLPVGKYSLSIYGEDINGIKKTVNLEGDRSVLELGTVDLGATPIAKLKGKPLPEFQITDARGVKPDVKLADYKGKWVYLEFWGFW